MLQRDPGVAATMPKDVFSLHLQKSQVDVNPQIHKRMLSVLTVGIYALYYFWQRVAI